MVTISSITTHTEVPFSPYPHQYLLFLVFFDNRHSNWCEVRLHCDFDLQFMVVNDGEHFFNVPIVHLCVFFRKRSIQILSPFLI